MSRNNSITIAQLNEHISGLLGIQTNDGNEVRMQLLTNLSQFILSTAQQLMNEQMADIDLPNNNTQKELELENKIIQLKKKIEELKIQIDPYYRNKFLDYKNNSERETYTLYQNIALLKNQNALQAAEIKKLQNIVVNFQNANNELDVENQVLREEIEELREQIRGFAENGQKTHQRVRSASDYPRFPFTALSDNGGNTSARPPSRNPKKLLGLALENPNTSTMHKVSAYLSAYENRGVDPIAEDKPEHISALKKVLRPN